MMPPDAPRIAAAERKEQTDHRSSRTSPRDDRAGEGRGGDLGGRREASTGVGDISLHPRCRGIDVPRDPDPIAVDAGTYRIARSAWSLADFTVTFPEGWTVQSGYVFAAHPDADDELGFYAVVVDEVYADACDGETGELMEFGLGEGDPTGGPTPATWPEGPRLARDHAQRLSTPAPTTAISKVGGRCWCEGPRTRIAPA
jgi:hypothetical protein